VDVPALHRIRPFDIIGKRAEDTVDVARVEGFIRATK